MAQRCCAQTHRFRPLCLSSPQPDPLLAHPHTMTPSSTTQSRRTSSGSWLLTAAITLAVLVRVLVPVAFPDLAETLASRPEVATPITQFQRLTEGVYLMRHGISPYDGNVVYQTPILLALFEALPSFLHRWIFVLCDIAIAAAIRQISQSKDEFDQILNAELSAKPTSPSSDDEIPEDVVSASTLAERKPSDGNGKDNDNDSSNDNSNGDDRAESKLDRVLTELQTEKAIEARSLDPWLITLLYLASPFSIASCIGMSLGVFDNLAIVLAVDFAIQGKRLPSMAFLAFATYLGMYPVILIFPCVLLISRRRNTGFWVTLLWAGLFYALSLAFLLGLSRSIAGSWSFINSTFGTILLVPDLTPNIGLWWYIFIEMFDQFRTFFLAVFQLWVVVFAVPISIRFKNSPLFVVLVLLAVVSTLKSYPSFVDLAVYLPLVGLYADLYKYMTWLFFSLSMLAYATILLPLFFHLWIGFGAGNANFFYAITLVFSLAQVILTMDLVSAMKLCEWERRHPRQRNSRLEVHDN
ncbi:GPI transamidase subunit PIG-U [Polychytrium aggregatum]|uniref:GPI transamidase subunit PIG-U n=1 Tax=Polychytrium aggregatum TaxID=110093 RepID=UPI0022FE9FB1|nr:GPI transamidase subunit PIG-U [Polychytrium aggregatum]KAI9206016.1 GPI transamidase subunit PIG-U [Polychytrium aggregatum]